VKKLKALQAAIDSGTFVEPSRMTVGQWLDIWAAEYLGGVKSSTMYAYKVHITNHIKPSLGAVRLQKLNPHNVQEFYNRMQREKGLTPNTIKNLHGVLHSAMKQATMLGYIKQNPTDNMVLPRVEKAEMHTLPEAVFPAFLNAIAARLWLYILHHAIYRPARRRGIGANMGLRRLRARHRVHKAATTKREVQGRSVFAYLDKERKA
jgi:hypothetical protein